MKRILVTLVLLTPGLLLAQPETGELETGQLADLLAAEQAARTAGDPSSLIPALEDLGNAHRERGDLAKALASYRESLKLARELGDQPPIARNLLAIGQIHVREGRAPAGASSVAARVVSCRLPDSQAVTTASRAVAMAKGTI